MTGGLRIGAVVLAAGLSRRMEGRHKLLLEIGGTPIIRRTVVTVLASGAVETVVVTGHEAASVGAALDGLPVRLVHNPAYRDGQPGSVAAGVGALAAHCHAVIVVPGDQALLAPADLRALMRAYGAAERGSILVPFHRGERGNPVLFAAHHIPAVSAGGLNPGCRKLIETNAGEVIRVEFDSDAYVVDCDTPADYAAVSQRLAGAVPC